MRYSSTQPGTNIYADQHLTDYLPEEILMEDIGDYVDAIRHALQGDTYCDGWEG